MTNAKKCDLPNNMLPPDLVAGEWETDDIAERVAVLLGEPDRKIDASATGPNDVEVYGYSDAGIQAAIAFPPDPVSTPDTFGGTTARGHTWHAVLLTTTTFAASGWTVRVYECEVDND